MEQETGVYVHTIRSYEIHLSVYLSCLAVRVVSPVNGRVADMQSHRRMMGLCAPDTGLAPGDVALPSGYL